MSTAKRALKKQVALHAITKGKEPVRKLPDTLKLEHSQVVALIALNNSDQALDKQITEATAQREANKRSRIQVLMEVTQRHSVTLAEIETNYCFNGSENLFRPTE